MKLTQSLEDYIEAVKILQKEKGYAALTEISDFLKVKKPSVFRALEILKKKNLINKEKYGKITLTPSGEKLSGKILGYHEKLASLLKDIIGIEEEKALKYACILEHSIDESAYEKISAFVDKHDKGNVMNETKSLLDLKEQERAEVISLNGGENFAAKLKAMGIYKGAVLKRIYSPSKGPVIIELLNTKVAIGRKMAERIKVKKI